MNVDNIKVISVERWKNKQILSVITREQNRESIFTYMEFR